MAVTCKEEFRGWIAVARHQELASVLLHPDTTQLTSLS